MPAVPGAGAAQLGSDYRSGAGNSAEAGSAARLMGNINNGQLCRGLSIVCIILGLKIYFLFSSGYIKYD